MGHEQEHTTSSNSHHHHHHHHHQLHQHHQNNPAYSLQFDFNSPGSNIEPLNYQLVVGPNNINLLNHLSESKSLDRPFIGSLDWFKQ